MGAHEFPHQGPERGFVAIIQLHALSKLVFLKTDDLLAHAWRQRTNQVPAVETLGIRRGLVWVMG